MRSRKAKLEPVGSDITERKKMEEALKKSEKHLQNILDGLGQHMLVGLMTPEGTLIEANRPVLETAGLKREDVLGKPFEETYWWSYSKLVKQQLRDAIRQAARGESCRYDVVVRVGENRFITIDFSLQPLFDKAGRVTYLVPSATDITERVRLEAKAAEQVKIEKAIGRVLREGLKSSDPTATGQACLEVALEITSSAFGFVGELNKHGTFDTTFLTDPGWEACRIPKDQAVVLLKDMEVRGVWGEVIKHNRALITNDLSSHPASVGIPKGHPPIRCFMGVPLSRGEQAFGVICVANKADGYTEKDREFLERLSVAFEMALDRSRAEKALRDAHDGLETKVAERTKELAQANIQLKEFDRLKSMFIASMSHELRTPLNSIIGFTGIILQGMAGEITEEQSKQLTMVKNSANHLLALINDIIDLSKIEAGKIELAIEKIDLSGLIQEVKDSFKIATAEKGIRISLDMPKKLIIESDERRTKQIVMNLMGNAVKFTDRGEIEIKVIKKDMRVDVSVRDAGIGIRKKDMDRLFKAFSQIHAKGGPKQEGTGLGLYLSKKIAGLLGGKISVESEFGKGCKFTFTLPIRYKKIKT